MSSRDSEKYYWLKLYGDLFTSKRIKKLRKLGADFFIIYLKMQLIALKDNGYLNFDGIENTLAEEIALEIDEDEGKVQVTLSYLQSCGLLECEDDGKYFLPYVEKCTGSETRVAERMRKSRANKKVMCNNVTPLLHTGYTDEEHCYLEKEKEIEIEIEKEKEIDKKENNKREKTKVFFPEDETLNTTFLEYVKFRKEIKAPLTDHACELAINKLMKLANNDNDKAIKILEQSIVNGWKGLFDLKDNQPSRNGTINWDEV